MRVRTSSRLKTGLRLAAAIAVGLGLSACLSVKIDPFSGAGKRAPYAHGALRAYSIDGRTYRPEVVKHYDKKGVASWYSYPAGTRQTADGEWFDGRRLTAAHKTLPLPCIVEVTNLENGKKIKVRVNDRGPFVRGRIIDLSQGAAEKLGFVRQGTTRVRVRFVGPAPVADSGEILLAAADPHTGGAALAGDAATLY